MERRIYSDQDIQQVNQAEKELRVKGLDEQGQRIGDLIDDFFQTNRGVPVTVATIFKLVEAQPGLKWLSQVQLEYNKVASENVYAAQQLVAWLNTQGKPGQLANTGDEAYRNLTELLRCRTHEFGSQDPGPEGCCELSTLDCRYLLLLEGR